MKIFIELPEGGKPEQAVLLKKFLESAAGKEIKSVEVDRSVASPGQMGAGVIGSLTAVLVSVAGPFSRIAEAFSKFSASHRTELILKNEYGDELILNTKRVDKDGIHQLVQQFLEKSRPKPATVKRKTKA
jgi:hypothetical protein